MCDEGVFVGPGPGDHQLAGHPVCQNRGDCGVSPDPLCPALSKARLGGARSSGTVGQPVSGCRPVCGEKRRGARGDRRCGVGQPAGDGLVVGAPDRAAGGTGHRLAVPPDGGVLHPAPRGGVWGGHPGQDGAGARRLFLRHQVPLAVGPHPRCPAAGPGGGTAVRDGGQLAPVEPHRRTGPRLGCLQLLPDHAL